MSSETDTPLTTHPSAKLGTTKISPDASSGDATHVSQSLGCGGQPNLLLNRRHQSFWQIWATHTRQSILELNS